jgi:hypothetical protein
VVIDRSVVERLRACYISRHCDEGRWRKGHHLSVEMKKLLAKVATAAQRNAPK